MVQHRQCQCRRVPRWSAELQRKPGAALPTPSPVGVCRLSAGQFPDPADAHPAIWEGGGMMMGFDMKNDAMVTSGPLSRLIAEGATTQAIISNDEYDGAKFETAAQAGMPSMLVDSYNDNWLPRVGAAWQPFGTR